MSDEDDNPNIVYSFKPQPGPQTRFLRCPVEDVLYGGARGGGKSYAVLGHFPAKAAQNYATHGKPNSFNGLILRRTYPEFRQLLEEALKIYKGIALWEAGAKRFVFPEDSVYGGAILYFGYLDYEKHAGRYQGLNLQWLCAEEAQAWANPAPLDKLKATLRSSVGGKTYFIITANPGGPGHGWIKRRYVDPSRPNKAFDVITKFDGETYITKRVYIPSLLSDNKLLMLNDPNYAARIVDSGGGNVGLIRGWLHGDWNIQAGGFFDGWRQENHILDPFVIPESWAVYRSYDWGSSAPYSIGWHAVSDGTAPTMSDGSVRNFPRGTVFRISELYGAKPGTDEGLRGLELETIKAVLEREKTFPFKVRSGPADISIFSKQNGRSLSSEWEANGIFWKHADKSAGSRITGWQQMRTMLAASLQEPQEKPGFFVFDVCEDFIRTIPMAQICEKNPEDLDSDADHTLDECRYFLLHKPNTLRLGNIKGY